MPTGRPVEITRKELSSAELRRGAARSRNAYAARRMLALALVLEGRSRKEAAESCGMVRQTLRDWVVRTKCGRINGSVRPAAARAGRSPHARADGRVGGDR